MRKRWRAGRQRTIGIDGETDGNGATDAAAARARRVPKSRLGPEQQRIFGLRTLLAVFAHPDDESFGPGGTLAKYAAEGASVHLICATRGGAGEKPPDCARECIGLADLREQELHCAASELGLAGVHLLHYLDSGMAGAQSNDHPQALMSAPVAEVADRVAGLMLRLRPQVVITFDPAGGYGHPDHIAMHRATVAAWDQVSSEAESRRLPWRLYYTTFPRNLVRWAVRVLPLVGVDPERMGRNRDINLRSMLDHELPVTTRIGVAPHLEAKQRAIACHASQAPGRSTGFGRLGGRITRRWQTAESFHRARPGVAAAAQLETDLFDDNVGSLD